MQVNNKYTRKKCIQHKTIPVGVDVVYAACSAETWNSDCILFYQWVLTET